MKIDLNITPLHGDDVRIVAGGTPLTVHRNSLLAKCADALRAASQGEITYREALKGWTETLAVAFTQCSMALTTANAGIEVVELRNENARLRALVEQYRLAVWSMHEQCETAINADDWDTTKEGVSNER